MYTYAGANDAKNVLEMFHVLSPCQKKEHKRSKRRRNRPRRSTGAVRKTRVKERERNGSVVELSARALNYFYWLWRGSIRHYSCEVEFGGGGCGRHPKERMRKKRPFKNGSIFNFRPAEEKTMRLVPN